MFSIMTIASSTTNPVEIVNAMSVRLFKLYPSRYMTPNVPTRERGTAIPGMIVADALRSWTKPTRVIWGADDRVLPLQIAHGLAAMIPGTVGPPLMLEGASHFLQEDKPDEVAAGIRELLAR